MSSKRKRVVLSMNDKVKIIDQLNKGMSGKQLAEIYNVGNSTISDIKKNSSSIMNFVSTLEGDDGNLSRKIMRTAENRELEEAVLKWFLEQRSIGNPLSGPIICDKAKILAGKIDGLSKFKASNGWLRNFKARHGIQEFELGGKKLISDMNAVDKFLELFKIETKNYDPEFLYNADETGLNWDALPCTSWSTNSEINAPGHQIGEERVTLLACTNSTGSHRLPLLLIGELKKVMAFKNARNLPLVYKSQPKAWMTVTLFLEWYDEVFIPEVKKYQEEVGKKKNVLLLIDSAPIHPSENLLERDNGRFKALFIPSNVTSLLQPMNLGIIEFMKHHYRRQLLRKMLLVGEEATSTYYKKIDLKECSYMISDSWNSIKIMMLKKAWNKLKGISIKLHICEEEEDMEKEGEERVEEWEDEIENDVEQEISIEDIHMIILNIPGYSECNGGDVYEWLQCDSTDPGFQILSDSNEECLKDESQNGNEEEALSVELDVEPTASEAFTCFDTILRWMECQPECSHRQLLTVKSLRDLAAIKRASHWTN